MIGVQSKENKVLFSDGYEKMLPFSGQRTPCPFFVRFSVIKQIKNERMANQGRRKLSLALRAPLGPSSF